jgi:four helix bundle protein
MIEVSLLGMMNFHENKLWQDSYVVLMEIHDLFDDKREGELAEIVEDVLESATAVTSKIADGLSREDRRFGRQVLLDAVGLVAVARTHLAVAWGRGLVTDETFKGLDDKYAALTESIQRSR